MVFQTSACPSQRRSRPTRCRRCPTELKDATVSTAKTFTQSDGYCGKQQPFILLSQSLVCLSVHPHGLTSGVLLRYNASPQAHNPSSPPEAFLSSGSVPLFHKQFFSEHRGSCFPELKNQELRLAVGSTGFRNASPADANDKAKRRLLLTRAAETGYFPRAHIR